ncbi:MAG: PAS domain S-box protein, partial [Chloroflexi bacterium]
AGMNRLHELSTRFVTQGDMQTLLDAVLEAAIAITGADKGHVQLLEAASGQLGITAQRGFDPAFVEHFSHIRAGVVACGTAMKTRQCVVVEDVTLSPLFLAEPRALELVLAAGMRAVVCTPLQTRTAQMVGVLSILFAAPHRPSERDLRMLDLMARQAADFVERTKAGEAQEQLAAIVEWSEDTIISQSLEGIIRTWNAGAERMFGYRAEEVIGQPVTLLMPPELMNEENQVRERVRRGEPVEHFETVRVTKDGRKLQVALTVSPVRDSQGRVVGASKIVRDIGEIVRAREVLARGKEDLERLVEERTVKLREAMAEMENMSYSMVHDMRAPLRAMQSFAMMLEGECADSLRPPGLDYFRRIREAADRLDRLITDSLNYNKVVRQQLPLTSVQVGRLLRGMIETYPNLQPPAADISLEFDELVVLGNQSLLTQCLGNLLDNAVKFVLPGIKPQVRVWAEEVQSPTSAAAEYAPLPASTNYPSSTISRCARIWIEDNGIGIPKEAQEKIFAIFQRMHHEKEYPGTGIGLAIARKAVERMGGQLGLESEPGKG